MAVSYTHLTLPTSDLVEISVVAVSLKKKIQNNNNGPRIMSKRCNNDKSTKEIIRKNAKKREK